MFVHVFVSVWVWVRLCVLFDVSKPIIYLVPYQKRCRELTFHAHTDTNIVQCEHVFFLYIDTVFVVVFFIHSSRFTHIFAYFNALFIFGYMVCRVKMHRYVFFLVIFLFISFFFCKSLSLVWVVVRVLCILNSVFMYSILHANDSIDAIAFYFLWVL